MSEDKRYGYYKNLHQRLDTLVGGVADFWSRLELVRQHKKAENIPGPFIPYLEMEYGIKLTTDDHGMLVPTYEIVDEQKYVVFLLKFTVDR